MGQTFMEPGVSRSAGFGFKRGVDCCQHLVRRRKVYRIDTPSRCFFPATFADPAVFCRKERAPDPLAFFKIKTVSGGLDLHHRVPYEGQVADRRPYQQGKNKG